MTMHFLAASPWEGEAPFHSLLRRCFPSRQSTHPIMAWRHDSPFLGWGNAQFSFRLVLVGNPHQMTAPQSKPANYRARVQPLGLWEACLPNLGRHGALQRPLRALLSLLLYLLLILLLFLGLLLLPLLLYGSGWSRSGWLNLKNGVVLVNLGGLAQPEKRKVSCETLGCFNIEFWHLQSPFGTAPAH